ncbi:hypothetical protein JAAARDRAFT_117914 [Jaapia argillacea MUCL 33604]|uniref:Uncharacterized protein n=1 Tax=Jaapia argillacea MUCL 33604 TaxID=933084 RepID=A0A067QDJ2_9AGAM|nr:hypothetical protein JAAARDRAFT_117914 [Jaapia argillacea MUCL 33604]
MPVKFWKALQDVHLQQHPGTRLNATNTFLSIRKLPKSLASLMPQADKGMQDLKALHPWDYTIKKLNAELHSMALICTLPAEYNTFISSLLLLSNLNLKKLQAAFQTEETQHQSCSIDSTTSLTFRASTTPHCSNNHHFNIQFTLHLL